jgi:hypothetical protein
MISSTSCQASGEPMLANRRNVPAPPQNGGRRGAAAGGAAALGTGAALTATLAGACCVGPAIAPIIVGTFGVGGAAAIAGLKPFMPYLFGASAIALAFAFWQTYRRAQVCAPSARGRGTSPGTIRIALWFAALTWTASLGYTLYNVAGSPK